ncbi:MAG: SusC/RagA family TonB-linked outer membrane protein [Chitinophagaceae bacterium]
MTNQLKLTAIALAMLVLPVFVLAQITVSGTVTDANNIPVNGASVKLRNSGIGVSTDDAGKFSLNIPGNNGIIEISSIGYKSQAVDVSAGNASALIVKLADDVGRLDEVVVTGLATSVKRRNLANAVATISSKDLSGTAPAQTFDAALNGKIPGANINANSGAPGGGISIKLRGVTSVFGNTQPLYVVDGVFINNTATPANLNFVTQSQAAGNVGNQDNASGRIADLRPEDIENIEILKGASAAAIYGSKAAAGVVLITTKRGKQGQTKVNFSQDLGFIKARKLLGVRQFTAETAANLGGSAASADPDVIAGRAALKQQFLDAQAAGKIYDYEKELYGNTGFSRNSSVSLTGGSEKTSFFFSASQKDEEGIVKYTGYRNNSIRLNIDHRLNENIKIGVTTNYINSSADRGLFNNDNSGVTMGVALSSTPNFVDLHPDANGVYPNDPFAASNPLQTRDLVVNNEGVERFITGVNLDAKLFEIGKSVTRLIARGGIDFYSLKTNAQFPSVLQFQAVNKGTSIQGFVRNQNTNYILSLVNKFTPSSNLDLTTSAGLTQENGNFDNMLDVATQVVAGQTNVDQAGALTATHFRTQFQDNGFFVQEEASIIDAITLTAGVRLDKSTNNGDQDKYYTYPKAAVSWNLTRMDFWKGDLFSNLKLRAAYGQAGNFPAYGSKFTAFPIFNVDGLPGSLVNIQRGSPDIKPERTSEFETGIDFGLLKGKLNFEMSFYNKTIQDFLLLRTVPLSTGFASQWVNAGDLRNRGIEIGMNAQPIATKNIRWTSSTNFWMNRSKVTKLTIPPVELGAFGTTLGTFNIEEGKSVTQIIGIDTTKSGAGIVTKLGDTEPKFQMNFTNEITFMKNLSFRFLLHWKYKGDNVNLSELLYDLGKTTPDYDADNNHNGVIDSRDRLSALGVTAQPFVQEAGYLRLREVALYYTVSKIPKGLNFIKGFRIGVSANNYFTKTKYKNYDPEVSNFGSGFSTNVDVMPYPASKRATVHLSVDL